MLLLGAGGIVFVLLVVLGIRIFAGGEDDSGVRPDQGRLGTVLLVPGYGGSKAALDRLAALIAQQGRKTDVLTLPGDGTGELLDQVEVLQSAVEAAKNDGAPSVDVIGYSAGGVVTRLWVQRHRGAETARRIVTLGSPLHGAKIAGVGAALAPDACPRACRELAPGSDVLKSIDKPLPKGLPWLSIWTEVDETVQPPESARIDGAVNLSLQSICPSARTSHGDLPTDPAVTALVQQAIGTGNITTPTTCPIS